MQQYFQVSPPSLHRLILALEQRGLIARAIDIGIDDADSLLTVTRATELPRSGLVQHAIGARLAVLADAHEPGLVGPARPSAPKSSPDSPSFPLQLFMMAARRRMPAQREPQTVTVDLDPGLPRAPSPQNPHRIGRRPLTRAPILRNGRASAPGPHPRAAQGRASAPGTFPTTAQTCASRLTAWTR
jgi:hypothetical protein